MIQSRVLWTGDQPPSPHGTASARDVLLNTTAPVAQIYLKAKLLFILALREEFCKQLCTVWRHCWPMWPEGAVALPAPCPDSCTRSSHCSGAGQLLCFMQTSSTVWPGLGHTVVFRLGCLGTLIQGAKGRNEGEEDDGQAIQLNPCAKGTELLGRHCQETECVCCRCVC